MSSTGQATSSTSNIQLIKDALADYTNITGIDLSKNPFAAALKESNSPEAILQLLQEREKAFHEYRDGNRRLINYLSPAVKVLQAFSGILGEAVGLIPFPPASALFAGIGSLLDAASGVTSSYDALLDLFECLGNFIKRLEVYTTIPPTPTMTDIIVKIIVELLSVLALATKQISQGRFKKFAKKLLGDGEIEAVLQRLDRLTQDEARMTVAQTLGVVHGLVGNMKVFMEDGKGSTDNIRQDLVALHQMLYEMNKIKRDQLRWDVQHWLSPPDPSMNHNFVSKARHSGTAAWFFESIALTEWKATGSFLWIHGKPGAGKSTLLSAIIQDIESMQAAGLATLAYYYFDFRDAKKQDCYGLLSSLISQLSAESDSCYKILSQLYSENTRGIRTPPISALKECLTDMLSQPGQGPIYIILDGLDECPNSSGTPSAREEVLELIEELVDLQVPNLYLCVASRPEMNIRVALEPLTSLKVSLHDESGQKEDIIKYIKSVVHSDRSMRRWKEEDKQLVIDILSARADGMFRWVVCQVDRLRRTFPPSIRSVLNDLPKTLDETYGRTLLDIDKEKREYAQRLFQCLMVSIRPLLVEELAEILAIQFDEAELPTFNASWRPENAEEAVISACSSLIAIVNREGSQLVQFSHFSVKEFLTSERLAKAEESLSYYYILPEPAHTILAHAGLSVLLQLDDKIDRDTIGRFPLAPYAARYWVNHAQFKNVASCIQKIMERLFDPSKPHFAAWVWVYDIDRDWIEPMSKIHPNQPEALPLYYAALSGFRSLVEHLIAADSRVVNSKGGSYTTPLHAASVKGHLDVALLLLENGADSNSRDNRDRAPLHKVSQGKHLVMVESSLEIARFLVNFGANVNVTDDEGWTPLHAAARSGYRDIAELLVECGASLDVRNSSQATALHVACANGKLDVSRFLIDRGSDINLRNENGFVPLHLASRYGHLDAARLLLDCGSDVNVRETQRWTPLHYASRNGYLGLVQLLIDRGADLNLQEVYLQTPLHLASAFGYLDITKLLLERGAKIDIQNHKERPPLNCVAQLGHLDVARFLIESGAAESARDNEGCIPFQTASQYGHLHLVTFLLERVVDVDIRNKSEQTSLYLASSGGKLDVVRFLVEHGADIHVKDSNGLSPLHMASQNGHLDVARFLIEHGADIHANENNGWSSLHVASQNGHLDVVRMLINAGIAVDIRDPTQKTSLALASTAGKVEVGRFLVGQGADINAQDNEGWTPLHFASGYGHLDLAMLLLDLGVDANIRCDDLWSPLHFAALNGHLKTTELLIQRGATVDVFNGKQETPLYDAVRNGKAKTAHLLINHGANLQSADSDGCTLLHTASQHGHLEVVKLLLQLGSDVDMLNKDNKTAAELATENDKAEVAKLIVGYTVDATIRSASDTTQYGADEGREDKALDEAEVLLRISAAKGNIDVVKSLLGQGVDINCRNADDQQTPLSRAAAEGNVDLVRLLVERGAEVDIGDNGGWTPLHIASRFGYVEVSRVLIDQGANVNARNRDHWTPMHFTAETGQLEIMKLLLERGAEANVVNDEGETPYQVSLQKGHAKLGDLLREHSAGSRTRDSAA